MTGVAVRVSRGRLVVRGATLDFIPAIETLTGREEAVEKALALAGRVKARADSTEAQPRRDRGVQGNVARTSR